MKKILRLVSLFAYLILYAYTVHAQDDTGSIIKGNVVEERGGSLPGVTVSVKNTTIAVSTDAEGRYSIKVPASGKILVFKYLGMATSETTIGNRKTVNVSLSYTASTLNDVVVIGYGSQRKADVNGSIASVTAREIANTPVVSIDQLLQGKAAGVSVTQNSGAPGSQTSVHIRGIGSLSGTNEPLYVIDGVEVSGDATNQSTSGRSLALAPNNGESSVSPLSALNPNDIASIDVLKDASASAIYGSRGSNGVIIITTKRGKNGAAHISYEGYYGIQDQNRKLGMMNLQQYAKLQNALADNIGVGRRSEFANPSLLGPGTNWQNEIFKTAVQTNHNLSVSGGKDGIDYYISGAYLNQDGTIIGNSFKRYSFRSNINAKVKPWLVLGSTLSGSRSLQNASISNNGGIVYLSLLNAPDQAVRNADGTFAGPTADQRSNGAQVNPVAKALDITNLLTRSNLNGSLYADLTIIKGLSLRSELNGDFNFSNNTIFQPSYAYGAYVNPTASLQEYNSSSTYWAWKEYLTYNHIFAEKHNLQLTAGHEVNLSNWGGTDNGVANFLSNDLHTLSLGDAKTATLGEYKDAASLESYFGRAIYTFNNKYSITASIRSDKSSKFAVGHQTGYFPGVAVSWRLSDEAFMANIKKIADNVKFRASYGALGNQDVPNYLYGSALNPLKTGLGTGFTIDKIPNPNLTWETALQTDIGLDFSLLNGRIEATVDYFNRTSKNFLFQASLPAFLLGQSADYYGGAIINPPFINGGKLTNKGFEFSITSHNIVGKDFKWNTSLNFSHVKNRVVSLASGVPFIQQSVTTSFLSLPVTRTQPGQPVGEFYGYKVKGIFKTDAQLRAAPPQFGRPVGNNAAGTWLGDVQYVDVNHDGKIDENDQVPLGDPNPKGTYSITNNFSYKGFDLSVFLNGSYGAKIFNVLDYQIAGLSSLYQNQLASVANFWSPTNPNSNIPAPRGGDNPNLKNSDRFIESGSFLRIQNIRLGYNLPQQWINHIKLTRLLVYASVQNLYTFTPYKGLDPEVGFTNQSIYLNNVDQGRYPIPRTITFGINAEF